MWLPAFVTFCWQTYIAILLALKKEIFSTTFAFLHSSFASALPTFVALQKCCSFKVPLIQLVCICISCCDNQWRIICSTDCTLLPHIAAYSKLLQQDIQCETWKPVTSGNWQQDYNGARQWYRRLHTHLSVVTYNNVVCHWWNDWRISCWICCQSNWQASFFLESIVWLICFSCQQQRFTWSYH